MAKAENPGAVCRVSLRLGTASRLSERARLLAGFTEAREKPTAFRDRPITDGAVHGVHDQGLSVDDTIRRYTAIIDAARKVLLSDLAASSARTHAGRAKRIQAWLTEQELSLPLPIPAVQAFLLTRVEAGDAWGYLEKQVQTLTRMHREAGHGGAADPTQAPEVKRLLSILHRQLGEAADQAEPMRLEMLDRITASMRGRLQRSTDRAVILRIQRDLSAFLTCWCAAARHEELCRLRLEDLRRGHNRGWLLHLAHSKTDQFGRGEWKRLYRDDAHPERCPIRALEEWLAAAEITSGYVFRGVYQGGSLKAEPLSTRAFRLIVKERAREAGYSGAELAKIRSHSFRAGLVTEMREQGAPAEDVMEVTLHRDIASVLRYDRRRPSLDGLDPLRHVRGGRAK